jgi:hypothetical protein
MDVGQQRRDVFFIFFIFFGANIVATGDGTENRPQNRGHVGGLSSRGTHDGAATSLRERQDVGSVQLSFDGSCGPGDLRVQNRQLSPAQGNVGLGIGEQNRDLP